MAFPTETVYGLGANAFDARAVARVFEVKARPSFDPLIVHLAEAASLDWVAVADDARIEALAARFWPGPLTLVLRRRPELPDIVTAGLDTVGVRVPAHPAARALIAAAGTPLAAPSANPFGYVSPTTAAHVAELLGDAVELVLDGGPCRVGLESTILSLAGDPVILRPGGLPREALEDALGTRLAVAAPQRPAARARPAPAALRDAHAARDPRPEGEGRPRRPRSASACSRRARRTRRASRRSRCSRRTARVETAAARLFAALRRLDALGLDRILAEPCAETGLGHAIMDRLRRAAARRGLATFRRPPGPAAPPPRPACPA